MARRRICALLLVAAATASADVNETAASEGRVTKFAAQSYDWLLTTKSQITAQCGAHAPRAMAFAAQHGPGFLGGAITALLCMLLGGKKPNKKGVRRASMEEAYGIDAAAAAAAEAAARDAAPAATEEDGKQTRSVLRTVKDVLTFASFVFIALLQQVVVFPLRFVAGKKYLVKALHYTAGSLMYMYCRTIESILGESSYGVDLREYHAYCSASFDNLRASRRWRAGGEDATPMDNSGGSARRCRKTSREGTLRWRGERRVSRRSTGKNRPLPLKPTLPRVLSRANASVVDEE